MSQEPRVEEAAPASRRARPDAVTLRSWWPGWHDVACLLLLIAATWYLVGHDGGRPYRPMLPVLLLAIPATIAATPSLRRLPPWLLAILIAWTAGPLLALVFADVRAGWVRPVGSMALFVPVAAATFHLLRRRWGPTALLTIVGVAFARSWYGALLGWWGGSTGSGEPAWMALSWHNQSGTLMAAIGIGALGVALTRERWLRLVAVAIAAAGLSAAWMSGSRAVVACAALAIAVVLLTRLRRGLDRAVPITAAVIAALSVVAVLGLAALYGTASAGPSDGSGGLTSQPVTSRQQDAIGNLQARFGHWEAALRMFATSPLTGTGPGSYEWSSVPVYPDDTNRTSSAHGEQIEALGELGLLGGGGAAVLLSALLALAVLATFRGPRDPDLEVAAAGMATFLVSHAALDFDWDYPVLLALLGTAAAVLAHTRLASPHAQDQQPGTSRSAQLGIAVAVSTCALLAVALIGTTMQVRGSTPWDVRSPMATALAAATEDPAASDDSLERLRRWNPGEPRLADVQRLVAHQRGELSDEELATNIDPQATRFGDQLTAAEQLLANDRPDMADGIVEELRPVLDRRRAWGVSASAAHAASVSLTIAYGDGGCNNVEEAWLDLGPWVDSYGLEPAQLDPTSDVVAECGLTTLPDG